ncbi:leucine-rich repeat protein soc-2 homolog isoform X2 [Penaeus vannamei]|uniref:leucine-rich repeat protein soc-2 homolog isoform X2 n=1 Tax=Penaeus vannamei TaxID=6689 RepID=UPI00387F6291
MRLMKTTPLFLAALCCVAILSPAALGREISSQGGSTCPCHLEPAHDSYPGSGEGNLMWNCRDRLLPSVPTSCWAANANVTQVDLFNHHITTLRAGDFDALHNLRFLNVYKGWLSTVEAGSLRTLTTLEHLDLGFGFLTEVPEEISHMPQLRVVALEYNQIKEVPRELLLPLADNLEQLIFVRNEVEAVPELDFLPHLTFLDLEANNIRSLPKRLLGALRGPCALWINDNPLSDVAAAMLLPLPNGSEIRTNASIAVWAQNDAEMSSMFDRDWRVYDKNQQDLDLFVLTHTCDEAHDTPADFIHPCEAE